MEENVICRLCLDVVPTGYTILRENILNTIKLLTLIDVSVDDNLPKLSCSKCIYNLYFIQNVRNTIIKSDEKLRTIMDREGHYNELFIKESEYLMEENPLTTGDINFQNVQIKEEKFNPANIKSDLGIDPATDLGTGMPEINASSEPCDNNTDNLNSENIIERTNVEDAFDESDIRSIICKKDNNKPYLYHCKVCNVDFRGNKMYMKHKGKHMKKTCEICGVTTRQDNFNKHMTKHKLGQQICDICGSIHKSLEGLRTHLFHFHNANKKPYVCGECGLSFKYSHRLSYHKRKIHTGFRPHQCDTCGKRFFDLGTMKKHVKLIHLKLREYHCRYCQKDYSSRYALKVHTRQHTDETPYVCEICSEGFRQLVSLKTHMAKHERISIRKDDAEQHDEEEEDEYMDETESIN